jgi:hypothetical protein
MGATVRLEPECTKSSELDEVQGGLRPERSEEATVLVTSIMSSSIETTDGKPVVFDWALSSYYSVAAQW